MSRNLQERLDRAQVIRLALEQIDAAIASAEKAFRTNEDGMLAAQTRNESRYDTYREEFSRLADRWAATKRTLVLSRDLFEELHGTASSDTVQVGSIVEVLRNGTEPMTFVVVERHSARGELQDRTINFVSVATPVASALLGHREGDTCKVHSPVRSYSLTIVHLY